MLSCSMIIQSGTQYLVITCSINASYVSSALNWYLGTIIK